jgi:hypothetical protein
MTTTIFSLVLIATVLIPGHVFRRFQRRFLITSTPTLPNEHLLDLAITGLWNVALTWPLLAVCGIDPLGALLATSDVSSLVRAIHQHGVAWLAQILVAPMVLAIFSAYVFRKGWIQDALTWAGIVPQPQCAQAFDAAFYAHRDVAALVCVTLKDGTLLYGGWDPGSAASSSASERDLFLSTVYLLDDGSEEYVQDETCSGILIRGDQIAYVTFGEVPIAYESEDANTGTEASDA